MTLYRFIDAMGDVVAEKEFDEHPAAVAWALDDDEHEENDEAVTRVEYRGPTGDWRWAGAL